MYRFYVTILLYAKLPILWKLMLLLNYLILKKNYQVKQATMTQKNLEIMVPLKYLSNFWRTCEMPLINCEIALDLNLSVATNEANHHFQ